jgi:hypothetical protein
VGPALPSASRPQGRETMFTLGKGLNLTSSSDSSKPPVTPLESNGLADTLDKAGRGCPNG